MKFHELMRVKQDGSAGSMGMVAVLKNGDRVTMNSITALRFYRRLAVGWENDRGNKIDPILVTKTLKNASSGVYQ